MHIEQMDFYCAAASEKNCLVGHFSRRYKLLSNKPDDALLQKSYKSATFHLTDTYLREMCTIKSYSAKYAT